MATPVETLGTIERRITITFPIADVQAEVEKRLKARARTVKAPGFRQGKVPMKMVAAQYGYQVETEVLNDKVGRVFDDVTTEHNLRVAGFPRIEPKKGEVEPGALAFEATFEIYPDVTIGDLATADVEKTIVDISEMEIDKTVEILRQQRVHYHVKGVQDAHGDGGADQSAQDGDRVTIDFTGTIDGVEFQGGQAKDYVFVLGKEQMLPEFELATIGLKAGETKTFPLAFPLDYHGKDVAGRTAEFTVTVKSVEWPHLPPLDENFAKSLGIPDGDLSKMREDIKVNLEREVKGRANAKTKDSAMDALIRVSFLPVPRSLIDQEIHNLIQRARENMVQRGMNINGMPFPPELFSAQAERRVRLGLILGEVVKANDLKATTEQVKAQVEEFAQGYEDPKQVLKHYFGNRDRLAEVEALVLEENVVKYVLSKANVIEKVVTFEDLMANNA